MSLEIYDEKTLKHMSDYDPNKGRIYEAQRLIAHHDAIEAQYGIRIMPDTEGTNGGVGLRERYLVSPAKDAWDEYEQYYFYHAYTDEDRQNELLKKEEELSNTCNATIYSGTYVVLSDKSVKPFSYSIEDQSNVSEMFNAVLMGATSYPYHANGESCEMYSAADIIAIYITLSSLKTAQITYYNQIRRYIRTLQHIPDIRAVAYGQALEGEYLKTYNSLIEQAEEEMQRVVANVMETTGIKPEGTDEDGDHDQNPGIEDPEHGAEQGDSGSEDVNNEVNDDNECETEPTV